MPFTRAAIASVWLITLGGEGVTIFNAIGSALA